MVPNILKTKQFKMAASLDHSIYKLNFSYFYKPDFGCHFEFFRFWMVGTLTKWLWVIGIPNTFCFRAPTLNASHLTCHASEYTSLTVITLLFKNYIKTSLELKNNISLKKYELLCDWHKIYLFLLQITCHITVGIQVFGWYNLSNS